MLGLFFLLTLPMETEQTACCETTARKIQTPGNHTKERLQHSEHGESLKLRIYTLTFTFILGMIPKEVKYLIRSLVVAQNLIIFRQVLELK